MLLLATGGVTLWPLDEARHITRLLKAAGRNVLPFLQLYHRLLGSAPAIAALLGALAEAEALERRLLNALAFGCPHLLPTLWRCRKPPSLGDLRPRALRTRKNENVDFRFHFPRSEHLEC